MIIQTEDSKTKVSLHEKDVDCAKLLTNAEYRELSAQHNASNCKQTIPGYSFLPGRHPYDYFRIFVFHISYNI